eukprot:m.477649 g.477649  ORF g.477649 m.477649 type:complete len:191 (+) comp20902_c0_seq1:983-1555(+)
MVKALKLSSKQWTSDPGTLMKKLGLQSPRPVLAFHGTTVLRLLSVLQCGVEAAAGGDKKDFSCRRRRGFYTGTSYPLAREWAQGMATTTAALGTAILIFHLGDVDLDAAPVALRTFDTADEGWQQCVNSNRNASIPADLCDHNMIEGPMARWEGTWVPFNPSMWQHCWFQEAEEVLNAKFVGFCFHLFSA